MTINTRPIENDHRPRMIVWQLGTRVGSPLPTNGSHDEEIPFNTHECLATIDSIARLSKPIVILVGDKITERPDLFQIIEYGFAIGLKIIIEIRPGEVTQDLLMRYRQFGPKIFRVMLDGSILEDKESRFKQTPEFRVLEESVCLLKKNGYELHFGVSIQEPDQRELAVHHDYAFRHSAKGLYCDLCFTGASATSEEELEEYDTAIDNLIQQLAHMKRLSPKEMYLSPQCVKYGYFNGYDLGTEAGTHEEHGNGSQVEWRHWCLAAKSYAFIGITGIVQACFSLKVDCGDLRANGYNFQRIWEGSYVFDQLRGATQSCTEVRAFMEFVQDHQSHNSSK